MDEEPKFTVEFHEEPKAGFATAFRTHVLARLDALATRSLIGLVAEAWRAEEALSDGAYREAASSLRAASYYGIALCACGAAASVIGPKEGT